MGVVSPWKRLRREKGASRDDPSSPSNFLRIVCRDIPLLSYRCCLVVSPSPGHAANDLNGGGIAVEKVAARKKRGGAQRQRTTAGASGVKTTGLVPRGLKQKGKFRRQRGGAPEVPNADEPGTLPMVFLGCVCVREDSSVETKNNGSKVLRF